MKYGSLSSRASQSKHDSPSSGLASFCDKQESKILKFLGFMWNPLSWVLELAAIMAIASANGGGRPPDWQDFVGIVALLIINSTISFIEENNAGNAAAALMASLALKTKVLRDGKWTEQDASVLVPGDVISIKLGDTIPADARLLEGDPLKIDQSALTAAHLVDNTNQVGHFQKVLTAIGNFCICTIAIGMLVEIIVMYPIQHRKCRSGIDNLLVLLIGGIPIAMPTVLSVTMAIGSHRLSQQGAITKRMTAIEELAGMDVLCSDKTGTLTLNKLTVDKTLFEVFEKDIDKDTVILLGARASRMENQDAIDACIVAMLGDPKEARDGITEVHFLPFNPVDKRTAITYIDSAGNWHRVSKGAPEQIVELSNLREDIKKKVHSIIDKFADRGLHSLAVARQEVPQKKKESPGAPQQFVGLLPLFDPPRHDSAETITRALHLGVNVKMITRDQLAIGKETGRRLGMGSNMLSSLSLGQEAGLMLNAWFVAVGSLPHSTIGCNTNSGLRKLGICKYRRYRMGLGRSNMAVQHYLLHSIGYSKVHNPIVVSGKAWKNITETRIGFTSKKDYGRGEREAQWAASQRTLHWLNPPQIEQILNENRMRTHGESSELAESAKKRAEVARIREFHTLRGHVGSVVKMKGLDIDTIQRNYTV
ncbi:hypothetical protein K1719_029152 [Acacia pycnantha]|nr:hypothetical protein K1719_029152 [Acacia pycnantha]